MPHISIIAVHNHLSFGDNQTYYLIYNGLLTLHLLG